MQFPPYLVVAPVRWKAQFGITLKDARVVRRGATRKRTCRAGTSPRGLPGDSLTTDRLDPHGETTPLGLVVSEPQDAVGPEGSHRAFGTPHDPREATEQAQKNEAIDCANMPDCGSGKEHGIKSKNGTA